MKRFSLIAVLFGFAVVSFSLARPGLSDQQGEKKSDARTKLEQLQQERIESLEKLVDLVKQQFEAGAGAYKNLENIIVVQEELIEAKLDATDKPDERIAFLKEQLKFSQEIFAYIKKMHDVGFNATDAEYFRAQAHCLSIEIKIVKEEAKQQEPKEANKS
jgi:hypothetical protein